MRKLRFIFLVFLSIVAFTGCDITINNNVSVNFSTAIDIDTIAEPEVTTTSEPKVTTMPEIEANTSTDSETEVKDVETAVKDVDSSCIFAACALSFVTLLSLGVFSYVFSTCYASTFYFVDCRKNQSKD